MTFRSAHPRGGRPRDRRLLASLAPAVLLAVSVFATASFAEDPPTDWRSYTLIGRERVLVGSNMNVHGSFAVTEPGGFFRLAEGSFQLDNTPAPVVVADSVVLVQRSSVKNVFTNDLDRSPSAEIRGALQESQSFPLPISLPTLPAGVNDDCTLSARDLIARRV